jgi:hypothetical protein
MPMTGRISGRLLRWCSRLYPPRWTELFWQATREPGDYSASTLLPPFHVRTASGRAYRPGFNRTGINYRYVLSGIFMNTAADSFRSRSAFPVCRLTRAQHPCQQRNEVTRPQLPDVLRRHPFIRNGSLPRGLVQPSERRLRTFATTCCCGSLRMMTILASGIREHIFAYSYRRL